MMYSRVGCRLCRTGGSDLKHIDARRFDDVLQESANLQRKGTCARADDQDQASKAARIVGGSEQGCRGPHVRADEMGFANLPFVEQPDDELAHWQGRQEVGAAFGSAEARQVDRQQPGRFG